MEIGTESHTPGLGIRRNAGAFLREAKLQRNTQAFRRHLFLEERGLILLKERSESDSIVEVSVKV